MLQNKQVPSASIQLKVAGNRKLTFDEVRGITEYVKGAVSDIAEDHIKITDTNYNYYNVQERSITEDMNMQLAFKQDAQNVIQEQVNTVLTPIFGFSGFMAVVNADLNFDEVSTSSTEWAPPVAGMTEGLAVSASKLLEIVRPGFETGDIPGTDSNGLGSVEYPYGNITSDEDYLRALDERNYELNEFHTEVTQARGAVERLTVAVTIDANLVPDDYTSEVKALVVGATGAAAKDVTVMRLPFLENTDAVKALELNESIEAKRRSQELLRLILVLVCILAAVILLAVMLVSIARIYNRRMEEEAKALSAQLSAEAMAARAVAGQYDYPVGATMDILIGDDDEYAELDSNGIPIRPIDPSGKSELLRELEGFIERDPAAAVTMLRNWLTEE
jgi:flagellar M-ring protein FliF